MLTGVLYQALAASPVPPSVNRNRVPFSVPLPFSTIAPAVKPPPRLITVLPELIVIDSAAVFDTAGTSESVTFTVKFVVPAAVGVPLIAPVDAFSVNPAGKLPTDIAQLYGVVPPVAANVCKYPAPTCPFANDAVVIVSVGDAIVFNSAAVFDTAGTSASVTFTVKLVLPAAVGVPLIAPVDAFSVNPAGRLPTDIAQLYGVVPPVAANVCEYPTPTCPFANDAVVIVSVGGAIVIDSAAVFDTAGTSESDTFTVKLALPAAVGVPLIAPVDAFSVNPAGRLPTDIAQLYGVVPPVAANVCEYPTPTCPFANDAVVIVSVGDAIVIDSAAVFDTAGTSESVTFTVKFVVPAAVGVPLIAPVDAFSVNPAGRLPTDIAQLYGVVPPVAANVCEYPTPTCPFANDAVVIVSVGGAIVPAERVQLMIS